MTEVKELEHVLEVLKKYDLPVSPILEYAINEKIEQLSLQENSYDEGCLDEVVSEVHESNESLDMNAVTTSDNDVSQEVCEMKRVGKVKKASILRVIRADGTIIQKEKAAYTLCQTIKEIGPERVYELHIPLDGMYLVTIGGNPNYPTAQHDVGNGYFVNVHSNNNSKKRHLEKIFKSFNLKWKVEIGEVE